MKTTIEIKNEDQSLIWIQSKSSGLIYRIAEGTGDNLLDEDVDEGYVDYIYYDCYESLEDIKDDCASDGGMVLLKKSYRDCSYEEILAHVADMANEEF